MISYEVFMGLAIMGDVVLAGSFSPEYHVEAQKDMWFVVPNFLVLRFSSLPHARNTRLPFDIPESEVNWLPGFTPSNSGNEKFGCFLWGNTWALRLSRAFRCPCTSALAGSRFSAAPGLVLVENIWVHLPIHPASCSLPRPRYDQLMDYGWKILFPAHLGKFDGDGVYRVVGKSHHSLFKGEYMSETDYRVLKC